MNNRNIKEKKWKRPCAEINENVWGEGYRVATKKLRTKEHPLAITIEKRFEIVDTLFPKHPVERHK